ncbi:MAG: hypothetical protein AAGG51_28695 [Cyanobacteria bacterium P01_G01_bin.54]
MTPQLLFLIQQTVIPQALTFGLLVWISLTLTQRVLHQIVYAFAPEAKKQRFVHRPRLVRVAGAIADLLAWVVAVMLASVIYQLPSLAQLLLSILGLFWNLLPLTIGVVLLAYCFSRTGNELLLSLLGFWYLQHRKKALERHRYFDLGDGERAEIETIHLLDTTFRLKKGGRTVIRPNAYLMHEVFGFAQAIGLEGLIDRFEHRQAQKVDAGGDARRDSERNSGREL